MTKKPKVTIIMPSLNVKTYIRQCMESVINQTLKEIEIICVDAGSDDGTLEILQEYAAKDSRIRLIHSEKKSYGYQVNIGFDEAKADYIGIVETDDYIKSDMFDRLYSAAANAGFPDVVRCGFFSIWPENDGDRITITLRLKLKTGTVFQLPEHYEMVEGHPSIWAGIYKKEFLFHNSIRMMEVPGGGWVDNPFLFRTMCEAERICWVNRPLYYYRRSNPKAKHTNQNASSYLKNCSIPMARINDIKDYLDKYYPDNRELEERLFARTLDYRYSVLKSPYHTRDDLRSIHLTVKRFHPDVIRQGLLERQYQQGKKTISSFLKGELLKSQ